MQVRSPNQEDPLEEEMATHYSILAWRIPWTEEPGQLQSMGSQRVGSDWVTNIMHCAIHKLPRPLGSGTRTYLTTNEWENCPQTDYSFLSYYYKTPCFPLQVGTHSFKGISLLWEILKEMGIPDHFIFLLRNLYAGWEVTIRTRHGTMHWFQIGKGVGQGCILSPCLFNLYAEQNTSC